MPHWAWVAIGLALSYFVSYLKDDAHVYLRKGLRWSSLFRSIWHCLLLSLLFRGAAVCLLLLALRKLGSGWWMAAWTLAVSGVIVLVPSAIGSVARAYTAQKMRIDTWVKVLLRVEAVSWRAVFKRIRLQEAEEVDDFWHEPGGNRGWSFVLLERYKVPIVDYHFENRYHACFNPTTFHYMALLYGDNTNTRRAEALVHWKGLKWLRGEIGQLSDTGEPVLARADGTKVARDTRRRPTEWLRTPDLDAMAASMRSAEQRSAEHIRSLSPKELAELFPALSKA